ncbi:MAG: alpha/beta fold hydrolase [Acidimicrobiia bacterium]|nr:alpha/beta fold hydrolase [Acidimicrobiia bacterium]
MRATIVRIGLLVAFLAVGAYFMNRAWDYSTQLGDRVLHGEILMPTTAEATVTATGNGTITLSSSRPEFSRPGTFAVEWSDGRATLHDILESTATTVTRRVIGGTLPATGTQVSFTRSVLDDDPRAALGLEFRTVDIETEHGSAPAWLLSGSNRWVVFVHGQDAGMEFALPMLPVVAEAGLSALVITYRNDGVGPADPSGAHRFGQTEWRDLHDAIRFIIGTGGTELVLVGQGMGGSIVMAFQEQSSLSSRVTGIVLDAPILDLSDTVDFVDVTIPTGFRTVAKQLAAFRFDIRWAQLDYLRGASTLEVPVLLFHGTQDATVPLATSEALDNLLEDLVIYRPVAGAGHGESWNVEPTEYEDAFGDFLRFVDQSASSG